MVRLVRDRILILPRRKDDDKTGGGGTNEKQELKKKWTGREKTYMDDCCSLSRLDSCSIRRTALVMSSTPSSGLRGTVNGPAAHTCSMLDRRFTAQLMAGLTAALTTEFSTPFCYQWPLMTERPGILKSASCGKFSELLCSYPGDRGGTVVKALCYKPEGRWFDSRWCHWNFSFT